MIDQAVRERRADHCAAAEAHDCEARRHAAAVREPLDQRRDGRDVAEPQSDAADDARAEPQQPDLVGVNPERGDEEAAAPAQCRDDAGFARTRALEPMSEERGRRAQQDEEERVRPAEHGHGPIAACRGNELEKSGSRAGSGLVDSDSARERQPEHAEAVGHADRQVDGERCRRNQPPVIAGRRDRALLVQRGKHAATVVPGRGRLSPSGRA